MIRLTNLTKRYGKFTAVNAIDLEVPKGPSGARLDARQKLLSQLDELQRRTESYSTQMHDSAYDRAFRLLTSPKAKRPST